MVDEDADIAAPTRTMRLQNFASLALVAGSVAGRAIRPVARSPLVEVCASIDADIKLLLLGDRVVGHVDVCLCLSALPLFIRTNAVAKVAADIAGVGYVTALLEALIHGANDKKQCAPYPKHSRAHCSAEDPCGWTCDKGYVYQYEDGCPDPVGCVPAPPPKPCPSQYKRATVADAAVRTVVESCASPRMACNAGLRNGHALVECVDVLSELDSCGGCINPLTLDQPKGVDCTAIKGVSDVSCRLGRCAVSKCQAGWKVHADGTTCVKVTALATASVTGRHTSDWKKDLAHVHAVADANVKADALVHAAVNTVDHVVADVKADVNGLVHGVVNTVDHVATNVKADVDGVVHAVADVGAHVGADVVATANVAANVASDVAADVKANVAAVVDADADVKAKIGAVVDVPAHVRIGVPIHVKATAPVDVKATAPVDIKVGVPVDVKATAPVHVKVGVPVHVKATAPVDIKASATVQATVPVHVKASATVVVSATAKASATVPAHVKGTIPGHTQASATAKASATPKASATASPGHGRVPHRQCPDAVRARRDAVAVGAVVKACINADATLDAVGKVLADVDSKLRAAVKTKVDVEA